MFEQDNLGNFLVPSSAVCRAACIRLRERGEIIKEGFDEFFDPFKLILECHYLINQYDEKRGNTNASKKDKKNG